MMKQFTKTDLNKTLHIKKDIVDKSRVWYQIDASWLTLWRLAVVIAQYLSGRNQANQSDFWDAGNFVVVQNTDKLVFTGNKGIDKKYYRYSGYKGNLKEKNLNMMMDKDSTKVLWYAVKGMLPKNKLRARRLKRLKMFAENSTKYDYMKPTSITSEYLKQD